MMTDIAVTSIPGRPDIELPAFYESFAWYYPNCELQTKEWFVKNARPDWVYIDCGANIGYYSILFSQLSPLGKVHAVEPTATADMLEINIKHNRCRNIVVHRLAMGQCSGRRVEKIFRLWGQAAEEYEYDFLTLDHFVEQAKVERLDCIKIDVDSFDFEVLMGAEKTLERFDPWLVVELNHALGVRGYSNMAALSWLRDRGYQQALVLDYDNFVLRRSRGSELLTQRSFHLNFPP
jgi:FkbM family methyltransferase